ncbi:MAG: hypothetical protein OXF40_09560, partial [Rhodospirillales bacterium]|nr:hypothetical protein [Rhodospirillales bacterium]
HGRRAPGWGLPTRRAVEMLGRQSAAAGGVCPLMRAGRASVLPVDPVMRKTCGLVPDGMRGPGANERT